MTLIQKTIFDLSPGEQTHYAAPVRHSDPVTSKDAAAKANVPGSWQKVANILNQLTAASSYEIETYARVHGIAVSPSRIRGALAPSEMLGAGHVEIARVEDKSQFGNDAQIYRLTESGKSLAREA